MLIESTLNQPFHLESWKTLIQDIFKNEHLNLFSTPSEIAIKADNIRATTQLGTLQLPCGNSAALLVIETTDQVLLTRNRVSLRRFVSQFIDEVETNAVIAVFHQKNSLDWRITYAASQTIIDLETGEFGTRATAPKRFTFLVGSNEPCRTAAERLAKIRDKANDLTLDSIEEAFSVEKLSKEFFDQYLDHYNLFVEELLSSERAADTHSLFGIETLKNKEAQDKADKPIRDFVKKLLGRLVFLQFLQKKGWMNCPADTADWTHGDPKFLQNFFKLACDSGDSAHFHTHYLTQLFFTALNTERKGDLFALTGKRIPYLNGGLFDADPVALQTIDFPPELFQNLLNFFSNYNFTIDENDPDDHEVGIDPEMLGHIFENLLEDNKDKGAYYTPKPIVAYMCQQSLLHYLETHLDGKNEHLTRLVELHDPGDLNTKDNWCASHAKKIATLLEKVKICDPAIGSGAFPIGMLNEIVHIRTLLNAELHDPAARSALKKSIIQKSIYGVDLDLGAVEIARLRFWLALVVDEITPQPLPNLDYKIMQGNSLLERYADVDLSQLHNPENQKTLKTPLGLNQAELDIFTDVQMEMRAGQSKTKDELLEARRAYFAARKPARKAELRGIIDEKTIQHIRHYLEACLDEEETQAHRIQTEWKNKRHQAPTWNPAKAAQKRYDTLLAHISTLKESLTQLDALQHLPERPYFLWHLLFQDVFNEGGFDIVIANPPYVRHELIKDQKPLLQAAGYTTYAGTADLLVYFYEQATNLLKPNGILTFITSNKYYRAGYGKKLRAFLTDHHTLHTLIDFRDAPVFNGVIAYASILIGQKQTAPASHNVAALPWNQEKKADTLPAEIANAFPVAQTSLTDDGWRLVSPQVNSLLTKLRENGTPLGKYVEGRFYYGIKTGFNEAFVIDGKKRAELIASDPQSEKIIKPFLRGRDVKRWKATHADLWLIFTRRGTNIDDYPAIKSHLQHYRTQLEPKPKDWKGGKWEGRKGGSYRWFEIQDNIAYWKEFEEPKIVIPAIENKASYACDSRSSYSNDKTSICISPDADMLAAILNSNSLQFIIEQISASRQNGYFEYKPMYVEPLPIPSATPAEKSQLTTLAEKCAQAAALDDRATLAQHEAEINQTVYRLFHLTPEEITLIESTLNIAPAIKTPASHQGKTPPPKLKGRIWDTAQKLGSKYRYISLLALKIELKKNAIDFKDKTLRKYISEAMSQGIIYDAGRAWYSSLATPAKLDDSHVEKLRTTLINRFPFLPHYLWSSIQLNPWMHHLIGKPIHFLSVEADGEQDMAAFLRSKGWDIYLNPTPKTAHLVVPGQKCIVLRSIRRAFDPEVEPTVSTVLAEVLIENSKLNFIDEAERKEMTLNLLNEKRVDMASLLSRLKDHKKSLADLIGDKNPGIISEF